MVLTQNEKEKFYRKKKKIDEIILRTIKRRKLVVFGAKATNKIFPKFLEKQTED